MQASPEDFIDILSRIEQVKAMKVITDADKLDILIDLKTQIPAHENYARNCANTKRVVLRVLEEAIHGATKESPAKTKKATTESSKEKLLRGANEDTGGSGVKKAVVNKATQKRGSSKGRTRRAS
jgi:hypothetical protein